MSIKVRYFASLKEFMGRAEDELLVDGISTVEDVWNRVGDKKKLPENILVAINMEYVEYGSQVVDGDEIAFFPPVTGG